MGDLPATIQPFRDKIKERLQEVFMDLVPESTWDTMIEAEIKEAMEPTVKALVESELKKQFRPAVEKWVSENIGSLVVPEASDWVKQMAPVIAKSFMQGQTVMILESCMNMIRQSHNTQQCSCGAQKFMNQQCPRCRSW